MPKLFVKPDVLNITHLKCGDCFSINVRSVIVEPQYDNSAGNTHKNYYLTIYSLYCIILIHDIHVY